jgi:hypothetical protein
MTMKVIAILSYSLVEFNLSGRCINERNFDMLVAALSDSMMRVTCLDLSFNQFFKDFSLHQLVLYLERKAIELIDSKCKADEPILSKLK